MTDKAKKVAVIGLDSAVPPLIEKHVAEGHLPNIRRLIEGGVIADNCLVPFPTITPPGWASIATGAWPGTHQVTDFYVPIPGATPLSANVVQAFSSERWQAEPIWDTADRAGKKCIVLNYPGSWPSHMKNGIMVGGTGLSVAQYRDGVLGQGAGLQFCHDQLITTAVTFPWAITGKFRPAAGWADAAEAGDDPLEMDATMKFPGARPRPPKTVWHVLATQSNGDGYDRVTLSPSKDLKDAFCTLKVGEWSPKVYTKIKMEDGSERDASFRCKLLELSEDAEDFRLFIGCLCEPRGWSDPPEIAGEIVSAEGTFAFDAAMNAFGVGWFDLDTFMEINEQYTRWVEDAAVTLLDKRDWDVFFMHCHPPDWTYHLIMSEMDPVTCPDEAKRQKAWEAHLKMWESQDRMIGKILDVAGGDTLFVLVSDHGATADGPMFDPYQALIPAGLTVLAKDAVAGEERVGIEVHKIFRPDPGKSKAFPQRSCYIYINLRGRDPEGIVEPEDYEMVQQQIVDALLTYVDPKSGKRPVALALAKKDARLLGLHGDGIGDVVYAVYPWVGAQHGPQLPTGEWGIGSLKGLLTLAGPGIKKGYRLQRTCGIVDVVPTICYLLDLPVPETVEGAVLYQAFEDPNFKLKEVQRLREGLAKMEAALSGSER